MPVATQCLASRPSGGPPPATDKRGSAASDDEEEREQERVELEKEDLSEDEDGEEPVRWSPRDPMQWGKTRQAQIYEGLQVLETGGFLVGDDVEDTMHDVNAVLREAIHKATWWRSLEMASAGYWTCVFALVRKHVRLTEWCIRGHLEEEVDAARERCTIDYLHGLLKDQQSSTFSDRSAGDQCQTTAATFGRNGFSRAVTQDNEKRRRLDVRPLGGPRQRRRKMHALQVLFLEAELDAIPAQIMRMEQPAKYLYTGQSKGRKQLVQRLGEDFEANQERRQQGFFSRQAAMGLGGRKKQRDGPSLAQMFPFHKDARDARLGGVECSDDEDEPVPQQASAKLPSEEEMKVHSKLKELLAVAERKSAAGPSDAPSELAVQRLLREQAEDRAEQELRDDEELEELRGAQAGLRSSSEVSNTDQSAQEDASTGGAGGDEQLLGSDAKELDLPSGVVAKMKRVLKAYEKAQCGAKLTKQEEVDVVWWSRVDVKRLLEDDEVHVPRRKKELTVEQILAKRRKLGEAEEKRTARATEKEVRDALKEAERQRKIAKRQASRDKRDAAQMARLVASVQRNKDCDARAKSRLNEHVAKQLQSEQTKLSKKRERAAAHMAKAIKNNHTAAVALPPTANGNAPMKLFLPKRPLPKHENAKTYEGHARFVANNLSAQRSGHMPVSYEGPTLTCKAVDISKLRKHGSRKRKARDDEYDW